MRKLSGVVTLPWGWHLKTLLLYLVSLNVIISTSMLKGARQVPHPIGTGTAKPIFFSVPLTFATKRSAMRRMLSVSSSGYQGSSGPMIRYGLIVTWWLVFWGERKRFEIEERSENVKRVEGPFWTRWAEDVEEREREERIKNGWKQENRLVPFRKNNNDDENFHQHFSTLLYPTLELKTTFLLDYKRPVTGTGLTREVRKGLWKRFS